MGAVDFKSTFRVIIVGCGLGGLAASVGIRKAGFQVLILEQAAEVKEVGAGIEIPSNASKVFKHWGILEKVRNNSIQAPNIVLRSYRDGKVLSKANLIPHCENVYGSPHLDIHRADLHSILMNEAIRLGVKIYLDSPVSRIDFTNMVVHLKCGDTFKAQILIGADGDKSVCREMLLGRPDPPGRSGDLGFRVVFEAEGLRRRGGSLMELVDPPDINAWFGPRSHVVSYLLKKDDLFNVFLGGPDFAMREDPILGPQEATMDELRARFADWDPRLKELLNIAQKTRKWEMLSTGDLSRWTHENGRFTLLGDAAHGMLPYLGQGAAMAMEDAAMLGRLFALSEHPAQIPDLLTIYEHIRRPRTMEVKRRSKEMRATHGFPDGPLQEERDRQMALEPFEGYPNAWADPVFQKWLWGYDAVQEADKAWNVYKKGLFPGTRGAWREPSLCAEPRGVNGIKNVEVNGTRMVNGDSGFHPVKALNGIKVFEREVEIVS